jgi:glycosyltransferase involved in cell wall biosynthesis
VKILAVHNRYLQAGGEDRVFEQERALLQQAGHQTLAYERSNDEIEHVSGIGKLTLIKNTIWASDTKRDFADLLRREKPDVVHVHNTFFVISPSIYSACREARVPVIQTLHNFRLLCPAAEFARDGKVCEECVDHGVWRGVRYGCYHGSKATTAAMALTLSMHRALGTWREGIDRYIALSEFSRNKFIAGGLPSARISVKPNFVSPDPGEGTGDRSFALFVGRLPRVKGLSTLLAAWQRVSKHIPLHIIGDGPERAGLESDARERGLTNVVFRGRLPNAETVAAMKSARFLVFPSEWYENFPVTIAEAFACGTPVICSRLGSMPEIVADGQTGLHFTVTDAEDLSKKVEYAWAHAEEMANMGRQARKEFEAKYTAGTNYTQLMSIYEHAIAANV